MRNVLHKGYRENQSIHFIFSNFFSENRAADDIMSINLVEPERPQMAIWWHVACWISEATRPQAYSSARAPTPTQKHVRLIAFRQQQWFRERASILRYTYIACLLFNAVLNFPITDQFGRHVNNMYSIRHL
jgi:hypothetical protein